MNVATRAVLLATLVTIGLLPLLTGHALLQETPHVQAGTPASGFEHPDVVLLLLLTVAAFIPLLRMTGAMRRSLRASRRLQTVASGGSQRSFRGIDYVRVPDSEITLFTAGFRRPKIYASAGAESLMAPGPFHAALLHESAHAARHDVRWLALVAGLERALAFAPWSKRTFAVLRLLVERRADEHALSAGASRFDLFDALVVASASSMAGTAALSEVDTLQRLRWIAESRQHCIDETRTAGVLLATLLAPPAAAHLLLWIGVFCAACSTHLG